MAKDKIICDTDVMIDYWDENQARHIQTKKILENNIGLSNIVLSAITKMELLMGASNKSDQSKINKKLERFNIALINNDVTLRALELIQSYKLSHGLSITDSLIASTALITDLELFTYNTKDFKFISGLRIFKK